MIEAALRTGLRGPWRGRGQYPTGCHKDDQSGFGRSYGALTA